MPVQSVVRVVQFQFVPQRLETNRLHIGAVIDESDVRYIVQGEPGCLAFPAHEQSLSSRPDCRSDDVTLFTTWTQHIFPIIDNTRQGYPTSLLVDAVFQNAREVMHHVGFSLFRPEEDLQGRFSEINIALAMSTF